MSAVFNGAQRWQPPGIQPLSPWQQALQGSLGATGAVADPTGAAQSSWAPAPGWMSGATDTGGNQNDLFAYLASKQDTGGGESAQGPWSDNTPRQGGGFPGDIMQPSTGATRPLGAFGTTFTDPGGGWNPWSLYDGREGFDGSAVDGFYNAAADSAKWQLNGQPENDRNRVWRWTLDALGPNPGGQPPERVKQVFLDQVARLKRDYANTPGMNWQGSAFSGYDRFAQGGQGSVGGAAQAAAQAGSGAVQQAVGQQGGTSVADVNSGGGKPGQAPAYVSGGTGSPNGGVSHQTGNFGQMTGVDPTYAFNAAAADPGVAAHYLRLAAGQAGPVTGRLGQFRDNLYGKALQAFLALNGVGGGGQSGPQDMQAFLAALTGGGGGIAALLNGAASRAGGADLSGQQDVDVEKILRAALALRSVNMGSLGSSLAGNSLDNLLYQQEGAGLEDNGGASQVGGGLARGLAGGGYGQQLRNFLGASAR